MRRRRQSPDWIFYVLVLIVLWVGARGRDDGAPPTRETWPEDTSIAPEEGGAPPVVGTPGRPLPGPSRFDDQAVVRAENARPWSSGTAFAIGPDGTWLTARHVVRGCPRIGLTNEDMSLAVEARPILISDTSDVAVLSTEGGPRAFDLDLDETDLSLGARGFHVGYPQGSPGEVTSRLIGRERLFTEGAWRGQEDTLAWAEDGRSRGLDGTLGGLSGGPVFDEAGRVLGVTIAENPRRGRVITTAAESVRETLAQANVQPSGRSVGAVTVSTYDRLADAVRTEARVVRVVCLPGA